LFIFIIYFYFTKNYLLLFIKFITFILFTCLLRKLFIFTIGDSLIPEQFLSRQLQLKFIVLVISAFSELTLRSASFEGYLFLLFAFAITKNYILLFNYIFIY